LGESHFTQEQHEREKGQCFFHHEEILKNSTLNGYAEKLLIG